MYTNDVSTCKLQHPLLAPYQAFFPNPFIASKERLLLRPGTPMRQERPLSTKNTVLSFFLSSGLCSQYHIWTLHAYTATRYMNTRIRCARPTLSQTPMHVLCHYRYWSGIHQYQHLQVRSRHHVHLGQPACASPILVPRWMDVTQRSATADNKSTRCDATINHGAKIMQLLARM